MVFQGEGSSYFGKSHSFPGSLPYTCIIKLLFEFLLLNMSHVNLILRPSLKENFLLMTVNKRMNGRIKGSQCYTVVKAQALEADRSMHESLLHLSAWLRY